VTRKPLSQLGRGGGEVSCVSRPSGMAILNVRLEDMSERAGKRRGVRGCVCRCFFLDGVSGLEISTWFETDRPYAHNAGF